MRPLMTAHKSNVSSYSRVGEGHLMLVCLPIYLHSSPMKGGCLWQPGPKHPQLYNHHNLSQSCELSDNRTVRCALPSAEGSTAAKCKTVMIISVSNRELFNAISPPHADLGRLERGPPAPGRASLSSPSLLPRHRSERRCFKCQTGHTCEGLSALAEYKACLSGVPTLQSLKQSRGSLSADG